MNRRQVLNRHKSPSCDALVAYMLERGLDTDVPTVRIMHDNDLALAGGGRVNGGGGGLGPYAGRVNKNEGRKGTGYRLVPGHLPNTYRLIQIA